MNRHPLTCVTFSAVVPELEECPDCGGHVYYETGYWDEVRITGVARIPGFQYRCNVCERILLPVPTH